MPAPSPAFCRPAAYATLAEHVHDADSPEGLFRAAWAISLHERPDADLAAGEVVVDNLAAAVHRRVRSREPETLLTHLHDLMFDVLGFRGNSDDYYAPANSYLPDVLRTRRGLPITLTLVYRRVAAKLDIVIHGVNAPGHFLAEVELSRDGKPQSMYVDPFFGGGLLHEREISERITQATGLAPDPSGGFLARATGRQWLTRMLHNLQAAFASAGRERDVYAMQELEGLLELAG